MCVEFEIININKSLTMEPSLATSTESLTVKFSLAKRRGFEIPIIYIIHVN